VRPEHFRISSVDAVSRVSQRTIYPIALAYYVDVTLLGTWRELRGTLRHFRATASAPPR
jgi:predicted DNA-binding transcriptional regulator YafY